MWKNVEHIGIAVKRLDDATALFKTLLNTPPYKQESVPSERVTTSFFQLGETKIELLQDDGGGTIDSFIEKKGEGIHHIAFEVEDIYAEIERLEKEGFQVLNKTPKKGADNKLVCFVHPKSAHGVLVELCQTIQT